MARHRLYNLIEHIAGTENRYLLMDATEGSAQSRSHLVPDSPDWFAWLAGLGSFHFKGKCGHFTARQERKQRGDAYWYAYLKAHRHRHKRYLGTTDKLTLTHLEHTARTLHEEVLGAIPEDEALNTRSRQQQRSPVQGLSLGSLTFRWNDGLLEVKTPTEPYVLNQTQAAELLSYLYDLRRILLQKHR
jgi:hypothetical protein